MKWLYGATTCSERFESLLPQTLASLEQAGFDKPRLFIDGLPPCQPSSHLESTVRIPRVRLVGNWILALWELYLRREDETERFAIFQDDIRCCQNLREYLERSEYPSQGYQNLCTYPSNVEIAPPGKEGWFVSNQYGRGAQALVFSLEAVTVLLSSSELAKRILNRHHRYRAIDGGISVAMRLAGWKERTHMPSLVDHIGRDSSTGNRRQPQIDTFHANYNPLTLLTEEAKNE